MVIFSLMKCQDFLAAQLIVNAHEVLTVFVLEIIVGDSIQAITQLFCESSATELSRDHFFRLGANFFRVNFNVIVVRNFVLDQVPLQSANVMTEFFFSTSSLISPLLVAFNHVLRKPSGKAILVFSMKASSTW